MCGFTVCGLLQQFWPFKKKKSSHSEIDLRLGANNFIWCFGVRLNSGKVSSSRTVCQHESPKETRCALQRASERIACGVRTAKRGPVFFKEIAPRANLKVAARTESFRENRISLSMPIARLVEFHISSIRSSSK